MILNNNYLRKDLLFQSTDNVVVKVDMKMTRFWLLHFKDRRHPHLLDFREHFICVHSYPSKLDSWLHWLHWLHPSKATLAVLSFPFFRLWQPGLKTVTVKREKMREKLVKPNKWHGFKVSSNFDLNATFWLQFCKKIFKKLSKFVFTFESFTSVDVRSSN